MRKAILVVALIGASFAGGAVVNGPGLSWAQRFLTHQLGGDAPAAVGDNDDLAAPTIDELPTVAEAAAPGDPLPAAPLPPLAPPSDPAPAPVPTEPKTEVAPAPPEPASVAAAEPGPIILDSADPPLNGPDTVPVDDVPAPPAPAATAPADLALKDDAPEATAWKDAPDSPARRPAPSFPPAPTPRTPPTPLSPPPG